MDTRLLKLALLICFFALLHSANSTFAGNALKQLLGMPQSSLLLDSSNSVSSVSHHPDILRTPASTLKILTAWLAIEHWGLDHRFHTDFFLDGEQKLWIRGYGDPMLVSEEIEIIAKALATSGIEHIAGIYTDESYFQPHIPADGQSSSDNPYDAPLAPLAANFNTIHVRVNKHGLKSAEPQTPLTDTARQLATQLKAGKHRVNIGSGQLSALYFAELLRAKLRARGVTVQGDIQSVTVPPELALYYRHENSHTLESVLKPMLRYSTNFTANQLFLMLGAERHGAPASMDKSRQAAMEKITSTFNWPGFEIHEGAGLSRNNQISSSQMIALLHEFLPWKRLLYSDTQGIQAKSGTLNGISSYAGYLEQDGKVTPFALFIERKVPFDFRKQVSRELLDRLKHKL